MVSTVGTWWAEPEKNQPLQPLALGPPSDSEAAGIEVSVGLDTQMPPSLQECLESAVSRALVTCSVPLARHEEKTIFFL